MPDIQIALDDVTLPGILDLPAYASEVVVFAHGTGSSRFSPRNGAVAASLRTSGRIGTLLFDLLTETEDLDYSQRFDIELLRTRLTATCRWLADKHGVDLPLGLFGASTGAAAALGTAVDLADRVLAVVSRGGRPDLAGPDLPKVTAPTLLIVGGADEVVIGLNEQALGRLGSSEKRLSLVPGATHLFEEPGALEEVTRLTRDWFEGHVPR